MDLHGEAAMDCRFCMQFALLLVVCLKSISLKLRAISVLKAIINNIMLSMIRSERRLLAGLHTTITSIGKANGRSQQSVCRLIRSWDVVGESLRGRPTRDNSTLDAGAGKGIAGEHQRRILANY